MTNQVFGLVISNKDLLSLTTFDEVIAEIKQSLSNLRTLAARTNFSNKEERQNYLNNVIYLKQFYERAERILLDGQQN
jgi:hypothetical protein